MNERIRLIREDLKLSRALFGERLGISGDVVNNLERGRIEIKDDRIKLICSTYNVNEHWLRTGEGKMKLELTKNQEIASFLNDVMSEADDSIKKRFALAFAKLNERDWEAIEKIVDELSKKG